MTTPTYNFTGTVAIKDRKELKRDLHSKALINSNHSALDEYNKSIIKKRHEKSQTDRINTLEKDMLEVKGLLVDILYSLKGQNAKLSDKMHE